MKKERLNLLGINVSEDVSTKDLLELVREDLLDAETAGKVAVLREICEEFYSSRHENTESITTSEQASALFKAKLRYLDHEECWIAILDNANHCIQVEKITSGNVSACIFDVKRIVKYAMIANATGVILAHNHPSGNSRPSTVDIKQTKALKDALTLFDIRLIDHLILSDGEYYSFSDETVVQYRSSK